MFEAVVLRRDLIRREPIAEPVAVYVSIDDAANDSRRSRDDSGAVAATKVDAIHGIRMRMVIVVGAHDRPVRVRNAINGRGSGKWSVTRRN